MYNISSSADLPVLGKYAPSIPKLVRGDLSCNSSHSNTSAQQKNQDIYEMESYLESLGFPADAGSDEILQPSLSSSISAPVLHEVSGFSADVAWTPSFVLAPRL